QWMMQNNAFHRVRNFVAACGANHGVWTARNDSRGANRVVSFELAPNSPWLAQLNRFGETPGAVHYMTLYDGTGHADVLFPEPMQEIVSFLDKAREPLPEATPPEIIRTDDQVLRPSQADAYVHCEAGGKYPTTRSVGAVDFPLVEGQLATCFTNNRTTGLSSP